MKIKTIMLIVRLILSPSKLLINTFYAILESFYITYRWVIFGDKAGSFEIFYQDENRKRKIEKLIQNL